MTRELLQTNVKLKGELHPDSLNTGENAPHFQLCCAFPSNSRGAFGGDALLERIAGTNNCPPPHRLFL